MSFAADGREPLWRSPLVVAAAITVVVPAAATIYRDWVWEQRRVEKRRRKAAKKAEEGTR